MPPEPRMITFAQALREALLEAMEADPRVFVMGLGVPDKAGVFGTTAGLLERFGPSRVFDMPVSENAMTGVGVGAATAGLRPVMVHQRADFTLMAMDQIGNNAAKWRYMFGGRSAVPLTVRVLVGKGWGQGPQHSQDLSSLYAQFPGLKVVAPTTPAEAKGLLTAAIEDDDPVFCVEHRWLYNQSGEVPEGRQVLPLGKAAVLRSGTDLTVAASGEMAVMALKAAERLAGEGVSLEVLSLRTLRPLDETAVLESLSRTGRLLVLDPDHRAFGVSAEVAALAAEEGFALLKAPVRRLGIPAAPTPTSPALAGVYYVSEGAVVEAVGDLLGMRFDLEKMGVSRTVADAPDPFFKGPF